MPDHLQEKFQVTMPPAKPEGGHEWGTFDSARKTGDAGFLHHCNTDAADPIGPKFNQLPPGMNGSNQLRARVNQMPLSLAGESDVSADTNVQSIGQGYTRRDMKATDDQYTGEHVDQFYGEAVDENGNCGFVERNNYLDRE